MLSLSYAGSHCELRFSRHRVKKKEDMDSRDPPDRPKKYDRAARIKLTEEIMNTFRRLIQDWRPTAWR